MTGSPRPGTRIPRPGTRILGSLRSAGGKGVVRIEDRYGTGIDDLPVEAWEFSSRAAKKLR